MVKTTPREEIALNHLLNTARQLGSVEADAEVLARKAVELSVEGSDHTQKWDREFDADIENAIRELLGLKEPNACGRSESPTSDTGNSDQSSDQPEIW